MKFKAVITIIDFFILALSLANGFFSYSGTCYKCPRILFYAQFLDTVIYGLLLLIFFMCVSDMAKESIPIKMQLTASFSAAILYFLAAGICVFLLLYYDKETEFQISFCTALGVCHAGEGLLFLFREKLTRLT